MLTAPAVAGAIVIADATYNGTFTTGTPGGTVSVAVDAAGTEVDFNATGFGNNGDCPSNSVSRSDLPITGESFSFFDGGPPLVSISGFFSDEPGRVSGSAQISGACNTGTQSWTAEAPVVWPDGLIGRSSDAELLGDDIYNTSAAGQTRKWKAKPRQKRTFELPISNDGTVTGNVNTKGCKSSRKFKVKYVQGGQNVTAVTTGAGLVTNLASGESSTVLLSMKPTKKAQPGNRKRCNVTTRAGDFADTVRAELKAKSG
jgi:hypothetical protein